MKNAIKINGFTLVELIISIGIFALLVITISSILIYAFQSNRTVWSQLSSQSEGRKIISDFISELRAARDSSIGAYPLERVFDQEIIFYSNVDTDSYVERVRYFKEGTTLKKGVIKPTGNPLFYDTNNEAVTNISSNVNINNGLNPVFYYYGRSGDSEGVALTQPVDVFGVRMVKILLFIGNPSSSAPVQIEEDVELRNLREF